jgi:hypothetical protein
MWFNPLWWSLLLFELVNFLDDSIFEAKQNRKRLQQTSKSSGRSKKTFHR